MKAFNKIGNSRLRTLLIGLCDARSEAKKRSTFQTPDRPAGCVSPLSPLHHTLPLSPSLSISARIQPWTSTSTPPRRASPRRTRSGRRSTSGRRKRSARRSGCSSCARRWEAEAKERRDAEAARLAAEAAAKEADLERNKGVAHVQTLLPVLSTAAEAKGIRRRADKIALPRSWERTLIDTQQASKHGQLYFELNNPKTGRTTSASILDFSAAEGTVGLPIELLGNLGLTPETIQIPVDPYAVRPSVTVRYKQLKRGTFAKVQPVSAAFAADVGDVKSLLERELHFRTTLSVGDELKVSDEDGALGTFAPVQTYALRIIALEPEEAVSIIDTDLEVDVLPSVEAEEKEKAEADAAAARQAALDAQIKAQMEAAAAAGARRPRRRRPRRRRRSSSSRRGNRGARRRSLACRPSPRVARALVRCACRCAAPTARAPRARLRRPPTRGLSLTWSRPPVGETRVMMATCSSRRTRGASSGAPRRRERV